MPSSKKLKKNEVFQNSRYIFIPNTRKLNILKCFSIDIMSKQNRLRIKYINKI